MALLGDYDELTEADIPGNQTLVNQCLSEYALLWNMDERIFTGKWFIDVWIQTETCDEWVTFEDFTYCSGVYGF